MSRSRSKLTRKKSRNAKGRDGSSVHGDADGIDPARRNDDFYDCPWISICQSQRSTQLCDTLAHAADTDAHTIRPQLNYLFIDSFSVVAHGHKDIAAFFGNTYNAITRSGVAKHVGQCFLNDAKDRGLDF